ncbi:MAG: outer-membrane lipoprotein carrier protein LolA [Candidatus Symbiothrix sp.]|jgi:outer membrane lipoprotein-sorting protein|nr:outer-membrane lipoprotein carrier protein LolA [Candidatus Symbiothrix sp.]
MKKTYLTAILYLLLPIALFAQKDAKAKTCLDKAADSFSKAGALSIRFDMQIKSADAHSESFEGTIDVKGRRFHLITPDVEIWFDGKTQWLLQRDFDEVTISEPSEIETQALNPAVILSMYKYNCNYQYLKANKDSKGRSVHEVAVLPQAKDSQMSKIVVRIATADNMPVGFDIFFQNKTENRICITDYQKKTLSDAAFVFDAKKYPQAEVIDLR